MAFGTRLPPFDWDLQQSRQIRTKQLLWIEVHFCAEAAADILRDNAQLTFRNAQRICQPSPVHVWNLARHIHCQHSVDLGHGKDRARFEAGRYQTVVRNTQTDDLIGLTCGLPVVATADLVYGGNVVRHVFV